MIRRGFWLAVGAAAGITGYRKATKLARTLTGQQHAPLGAHRQGRPDQLAAFGWAPLASRETAQIANGGNGQPAALSAGSPAAAAADRPAPAPWPVRLIAGARATASFVRDVRAGMADYRELHGGRLGRNLGSQAGQIAPGHSPQGPREP
jgi:hypothetical protein